METNYDYLDLIDELHQELEEDLKSWKKAIESALSLRYSYIDKTYIGKPKGFKKKEMFYYISSTNNPNKVKATLTKRRDKLMHYSIVAHELLYSEKPAKEHPIELERLALEKTYLQMHYATIPIVTKIKKFILRYAPINTTLPLKDTYAGFLGESVAFKPDSIILIDKDGKETHFEFYFHLTPHIGEAIIGLITKTK